MDYGGKDQPSSYTGGVKAFPIEGRFALERERLAGGFTDADRAWRSQYLKDQNLHHEPVNPEWYYRERYNPIRRLYRWPMETLFKALEPRLNSWTFPCRYWAGKTGLTVAGVYIGWYIYKYHSNDWQNVSGWTHIASKPYKPMGTPGYNETSKLVGADYYDNRVGLKKSPI